MKVRTAMLAIFFAVAFWWGGTALAQSNQPVQITQQPTAVNVTDNSATITWSTNVPASSTVRYGTDRNNLLQTAQAAWGGTNHSVTVKALQPGQTYYFQVVSGQGLGTGTGAMSSIGQFTAGASQSASAENKGHPAYLRVVSGPIVQNATPNSAQVVWGTNRPASTILKYGTDPNNLSQKAEKAWGLTQHNVQLGGLQPNTEYYMQIQEEGGRELARAAFRTPGGNQVSASQNFQITNGPVVERIAPDSVVISWTTSAPASSVVMYGTDPGKLSQRAEAPWGQQTHRVTVNNLQPSTKYWFQVQSGQAQGTGQMAESQPFPVMTQPPGQAAINIIH